MLSIKVCGLRDNRNIEEVAALSPDILGFIYHEASPRFVGNNFRCKSYEKIHKAGVFVNPSIDNIQLVIRFNPLDIIQLHGDETPEFCESIKRLGARVWKAFQLDGHFDFEKLRPFLDSCDVFLFDTKSEHYGGSGLKFDWKILESYPFQKDYFLSGGLSLEDLPALKTLNMKHLSGLDLNSKFEIEPGIKDIKKIKTFLHEIRKHTIQS